MSLFLYEIAIEVDTFLRPRDRIFVYLLFHVPVTIFRQLPGPPRHSRIGVRPKTLSIYWNYGNQMAPGPENSGWVSHDIPSECNKHVRTLWGLTLSRKNDKPRVDGIPPHFVFDFRVNLFKRLAIYCSVDDGLSGHKIDQQPTFPVPKDGCHDLPLGKLYF